MGVKLSAALGGSVELVPTNTASNYTITLPANTGTVVTTGSSAAVTQTMLATAVTPLGVGQTWTVVTGSRAVSTNYTNTTGRPIVVSVWNNNSGASGTTGGQMLIDGVVTVVQAGLNGIGTGNLGYGLTAIVPAGSVYQFQLFNGTLQGWSELR